MEGGAVRPVRRLGLSLLEVVIACLLLALSVFFTLTVFTGVLRASNYSDERQEVAAVLEVLGDYFRHERHMNWNPSVVVQATGTFEGYTYDVVDNGLLPDPLASPGETPRVLEMRTLTVTVYFPVKDALGRTQMRQESSLVSVPR